MRPGSGAEGAAVVARTVTAVDAAAINLANYLRTDAIDCSGWKSVVVFPRHTGGTNPTTTVRPLYLAKTGDSDTVGWMQGQPTAALAEGIGEVVAVMGRPLYLIVTALGGGAPATCWL